MEGILEAAAELADLESLETRLGYPRPLSDEWPGMEPVKVQNSGTFFPDDDVKLPDTEQTKNATRSREAIRDGLEKGQWNVLAWYEPFHPFVYARKLNEFKHITRWGIFIRNSAIEMLADELVAQGISRLDALNGASNFLFRHESAHFAHEVLLTQAEVASSNVAYLADLIAIGKSLQGYGNHTEGLCNSIALSSLNPSVKRGLKVWLKSQLPGYRDWHLHPLKARLASWRDVIDEHRQLRSVPLAAQESIKKTSGIYPPPKALFEKLLQEVPVYFVPDGSGPGGAVHGAMLGQISPRETPSFLKDLASKGDKQKMQMAWKKTKERLSAGALNSVHLEKLKDIKQPTFSVQVEAHGNKGARAALVRESGWHAVAIDRDHNKLYERIKRISPVDID